MLSTRGCFLSLLVVTVTIAAPLNEKPAAGHASKVQEVQKQEQELQSLLHLAAKQAARNDVTVHESSVEHIQDVNGHKSEIAETHKTVVDSKTGKVLADVKQEVSEQEPASAGKVPEVKVKTEVDVPAEGVHETVVQSEPAVPVKAAEGNDDFPLDYTPEEIAEYILRTGGDVDSFHQALVSLVKSSNMTEEEARAFEELVEMEYIKRAREEYQDSILLQRRASNVPETYSYNYPSVLETEEAYPGILETPDDALYNMGNTETSRPEYMDFDTFDLLRALWIEAYSSGDVRAQALINALYEKVRDDIDPNDEQQIRDMLLDLVANSIVDEEEKQERLRLEAESADLPQLFTKEEEEAAIANQLMEEQPSLSQEVKAAVAQPIQGQDTKVVVEQQPIASSSVTKIEEPMKTAEAVKLSQQLPQEAIEKRSPEKA